MAIANLLERMGRTDITTHGFRSSFRDWVSEKTKFQNQVAEMALAHAIKDQSEAAYRRGDLFEKRQPMMGAWARYCDKPHSGTAQVVTIHRRAQTTAEAA